MIVAWQLKCPADSQKRQERLRLHRSSGVVPANPANAVIDLTRVQKAVESLTSKNFKFPPPPAVPAFC